VFEADACVLSLGTDDRRARERRGVAVRKLPAVREAGLERHPGVALEDRHIMTVAPEMPRGGNAGNAGT
jgi:hypothetical protein